MMSSGSGAMPSAAITSAMQSLVSLEALGRPVLERLGGGLLRDPRHLRGEALRREGRGVGQPAGERDHLRPRGDRHQVAHRRRAHHPRARGEQARVALEVARRRVRAAVRRRARPARLGGSVAACSATRHRHSVAHRARQDCIANLPLASPRRWTSSSKAARGSASRSPPAARSRGTAGCRARSGVGRPRRTATVVRGDRRRRRSARAILFGCSLEAGRPPRLAGRGVVGAAILALVAFGAHCGGDRRRLPRRRAAERAGDADARSLAVDRRCRRAGARRPRRSSSRRSRLVALARCALARARPPPARATRKYEGLRVLR